MVFSIELEPLSLLFLVAVTFVAAIVRGYTGFGFSALVVLLGGWILPPVQVVPIVLLMEIIASIHLLPSAWKTIDWPRLWRLLAGSAFSIPVGVYALANLDENWMQFSISLVVLVISMLILKGLSFKRHDSPSLNLSLGVVSGAMTGAAAIGGLAVVTVFLSIQVEMAIIRSTLISLFLATDIYSTLLGIQHGFLNTNLLTILLLLLPALFVGVSLGKRYFNSTNTESFRKYVLILLIGLSCGGMVRSFYNLYP